MSRIGVVRLFFFALFFVLPGTALAHATPVEMSPDSGENVVEADTVSIRFSERLEHGSSRIRVTDESGADVGTGEALVGNDPRELSLPITTKEGVYTVSWSVVSKDDGHFTKGAYAFAVGSSTVASVSDSTIVKLTSWKEVSAIFVEFLGNSILWGVLVLLILAVRPVLSGFTSHEPKIRRVFSLFVASGVIAGVSGAAWQVWIKGGELAALHSIAFLEGVQMYLGTASGESTVFRALALFAFGVFYVVFRKRLLEKSISARDLVLFASLLIFAYFRASISHATANPFHPSLSIAVNFFHLIDKDLWFGILLVLSALMLSSLTDLARAIIPRAFSILALNLAMIACTASYIVWLHLREFANLNLTEWGQNFLMLAASAAVLIVLRTYHVLALTYRPAHFSRWLRATIPAEMAVAGLVVFFSSLVIITSPPAHAALGTVFQHTDDGVSIRLEQSPVEDAEALVTITGGNKAPVVRIGEGEGALLAPLSERFQGGYVFPLPLLMGKDTRVEIIAAHDGGYDVHEVFDVAKDDFSPHEGHGRTFDLFTAVCIMAALLMLVLGITLEYIGKGAPAPERIRDEHRILYLMLGACAALCVAWFAILGVGRVFANDFKAACEADGNMWHMMQPMKASSPTSKTPREGCMLSSGTYHIADPREYEYLRSLAPAEVSFSALPASPRPGVGTSLTFTLTEKDGMPAKLSIEHEKILHVIVMSADMRHFAHIHADDLRALTQKEVSSSSFTLQHVFPHAGEYLIAVDYLHGLTHESREFHLQVGEKRTPDIATYSSPGKFGGYDVEFDYIAPLVGDVSTIKYTIRKNGQPVTDLQPYLSAAMHVAIVKNDLSEFVHTHGEVHPPGYVAPATLKGHNHAPPPARLGPIVEAHAVFPSPGLYTIFGEFKDANGTVIPTRFSLRID